MNPRARSRSNSRVRGIWSKIRIITRFGESCGKAHDPDQLRTHIKYLWQNVISTQSDYFYRVLKNVCARDVQLAALLSNEKYTHGNENEQDYLLRQLGDRMFAYFETLVQENVLEDLSQLKQSAFQMGKQHAAYSREAFKLTYWEMFSKAMVEELGESSTDNGASNYQIDPDTMKSWQHFLQVIIDSMMLGYENGRESQINNSFDTQ
ncbi:hypothetical protein Ddc_10537 [Ditylenchus destructor]|nr:hypothetical protein Ddc_10537 [Ditylenchus destructor]